MYKVEGRKTALVSYDTFINAWRIWSSGSLLPTDVFAKYLSLPKIDHLQNHAFLSASSAILEYKRPRGQD